MYKENSDDIIYISYRDCDENDSDTETKANYQYVKRTNRKRFRPIIITLVSCIVTVSLFLTVFFTIFSVEKDEAYLYDWLLENGELVGGTDLVYRHVTQQGVMYALNCNTENSEPYFWVSYIKPNYKGYEVRGHLPLDPNHRLYTNTIIASISLYDYEERITRGLDFSHNKKVFTNKTPIEFDDYFGYDDFKNSMDKIIAMNDLCDELSHPTLCDMLDWLKDDVCPLAKMDMSDFGYEKYK